jgi:cation transport regulator ChaB
VVKIPYSNNADLPARVREAMPTSAQSIFRNTFNSIIDQEGATEATAFAQAYGAVENAGYHQDSEGDWVKKSDDWRSEFEISKIDESAHQVFGWFSVAEDATGEIIVDKQGDFILPEDLENAAYDYVLYTREAGEMHEKTTGIGKLIASIVTTKDIQKAMGINQLIQVGWFGGFFIQDETVWKKITDGSYSMFSIGGKGQREEVNDD